MLRANGIQLGAEGITVRGSEFDCGLLLRAIIFMRIRRVEGHFPSLCIDGIE